MSVWPISISTSPLLTGSEGALVLVSVHVDARYLESLLDALAQVDFPINPQIYHDAAITYHYADGSDVNEPATLVEFPAYEGRLEDLRRTLEAYGFDPSRVGVSGILEDVRGSERTEPAPPGAPYRARTRRRHAGLVRGASVH